MVSLKKNRGGTMTTLFFYQFEWIFDQISFDPVGTMGMHFSLEALEWINWFVFEISKSSY